MQSHVHGEGVGSPSPNRLRHARVAGALRRCQAGHRRSPRAGAYDGRRVGCGDPRRCGRLEPRHARVLRARCVCGVRLGRILPQRDGQAAAQRCRRLVSRRRAVHGRRRTVALLVGSARNGACRRRRRRAGPGNEPVRFLRRQSRAIGNSRPGHARHFIGASGGRAAGDGFFQAQAWWSMSAGGRASCWLPSSLPTPLCRASYSICRMSSRTPALCAMAGTSVIGCSLWEAASSTPFPQAATRTF